VDTVPTVTGDVDADQLGTVLMHEHVFTLTPELQADYPALMGWDEQTRVAQAIEWFGAARAVGVDTVVDLTVLGMGRNVARLRRISQESGIRIVVATGLYTYDALPKYLEYVGPGTTLGGDDPMVEMFVRDITVGIADTGIRAAMLKCATDAAGITPGVERVIRAVARAHRETGAPITTHSHAPSENGRDQLDLLEEEVVDLTRVVIGHSGDSRDVDYLRSLADRGATLGMDRFGLDGGRYPDFAARVDIVVRMCELGYADRMVLSHDATCWMDWAPRELFPGTRFDLPDWNPTHLHTRVVPALLARGVTDDQLTTMFRTNPRRILGSATNQGTT
jgi:phosphotriesterase-related protein